MKPRTNGAHRVLRSSSSQGDGPNWILVAGGALLSALSVRLGYKLKQVMDTRRTENTSDSLKGNRMSNDKSRLGACTLQSNQYSYTQNGDGYYNCLSGSAEDLVCIREVECQPNDPMIKETNMPLPLVTIPPEFNRKNGVMWSTSPNHLELPRKPFHHSNSSDSPCVSESGSDIFTKREVIQKLRHQLKRRDDMIVEMQDQIMELQSSLGAQLTHSSLLQSQLDAANRDLFDSEREIQRLRKAIADHCVGERSRHENSTMDRNWPAEGLSNGHVNGFRDGDNDLDFVAKGRGDIERYEMLKREVGDLKEVIEGKDYLLQNYKEQRAELSSKVMELQQRLACQVPNIL